MTKPSPLEQAGVNQTIPSSPATKSQITINRTMVQQMSATIAILSLVTLVITFTFLPGLQLTSSNFVFVAGLAVAFFFLYLLLPRIYLNETFLLAGDAIYIAAITYFAVLAGQYGILILFLYFVIIVADALKYPLSEYVVVVIVTLQAAFLYILVWAPFEPPVKIGILALFGFSTISIAIFVWYFISQTVYERSMRFLLERKSHYLKTVNDHLRAVDAMRSNMMHVTSHEFQTPLASIKNSLSLLGSSDLGKLTPKQLKLVQLATVSNKRLQGLVRDLLNTSRIESGDWKLDIHELSFSELTADVVSEFKPIAETKKIGLDYTSPDDKLMIFADLHLIRLACRNLVDNAIKYNQEGGSVRVSVTKSHDGVDFAVTDAGIGMSHETQTHLWKQFSRDERAIKIHPDGYGIGLYYTKLIVERHHGSVTVQSEEDKGSTFTIHLPTKSKIET